MLAGLCPKSLALQQGCKRMNPDELIYIKPTTGQ
ncbi:conserved hypothetical protein [Yersinia pestis Pestoides F]|nr:conserved hypothetical protein [Yersinia pestis Pestoides F]